MGYIIKICKILTVGLLIIFTFSAVGLLLYSPDKLKPAIIGYIEQCTGLKISIPDKIHWALLPMPGIRISSIKLSVPSNDVFIQNLNVMFLLELETSIFNKRQFYIRMDELKTGFLDCQKLSAALYLITDKNIVRLNPIDTICAKGNLHGDFVINNATGIPKGNFSGEWHNISLDSFVPDASKKKSFLSLLSGTADISLIDFTFSGAKFEDFIKSLNGEINFAVRQGSLLGVNLEFYVVAARSFILHQDFPNIEYDNNTAFNTLTGVGAIRNGVLYINDLLLESPYYMVSGSGTTNLITNEVYYTLQISTNKKSKILGDWLGDKYLVLKISGSPDNLVVKIDKMALLKELSKAKLEEMATKIKQYVPKADGLLKKLFA